jgi:hypothetical protein
MTEFGPSHVPLAAIEAAIDRRGRPQDDDEAVFRQVLSVGGQPVQGPGAVNVFGGSVVGEAHSPQE